jgi:hypothetical protein
MTPKIISPLLIVKIDYIAVFFGDLYGFEDWGGLLT